jgi:predicted RNA binding protein YcfA (HicA-like mRNA interferase family)
LAGNLPSLRPAEVIRALERGGFVQSQQRGSHVFLVHRARQRRTTVALHTGDMLQTTLQSTLKQTGLTEDEFLALLRR